ncbi:MAG: hypothetical protein IT437_06505 [Phycisphaerales bacterium]|nr:hypothetical protein [Phycisphaerales bacterium]
MPDLSVAKDVGKAFIKSPVNAARAARQGWNDDASWMGPLGKLETHGNSPKSHGTGLKAHGTKLLDHGKKLASDVSRRTKQMGAAVLKADEYGQLDSYR